MVQSVQGATANVVGWSLIQDIQRMLLLDWEVKIRHNYRESNLCADALANMGCKHDCIIIFFEKPPLGIRELLSPNENGVAAPRIVTV